MIYKGKKTGKYISLRTVEEADAVFTSKLRGDEELCKLIHKVDFSIEAQQKYLRSERNSKSNYYFIIETIMEEPIGTIALCNVNDKSGEIGRWVSYGDAFQNLEAVVLLHDIAYEDIGLVYVYTCTNIENERVKSFWKRFGGDETYVEEQIDFTASKNIVYKDSYYKSFRPRLTKILRY